LAEFLPAVAIAEVDQFFTLSRDELAAEVRVTAVISVIKNGFRSIRCGDPTT
jgi:hypothetical protein